MGSGGRGHKFWCDKCQCYVDFSDFETCESICEYCEARENKARTEAAEAEAARGEYRPQGNDMSNAIYADRVALLEQQLAESKAMADAVLSAAHAEYEASKENITVAQAERDAAIARGAAAERAAVVAFLRETLAAYKTAHASDDLDYAIDIIERGEHRREGEK